MKALLSPRSLSQTKSWRTIGGPAFGSRAIVGVYLAAVAYWFAQDIVLRVTRHATRFMPLADRTQIIGKDFRYY